MKRTVIGLFFTLCLFVYFCNRDIIFGTFYSESDYLKMKSLLIKTRTDDILERDLSTDSIMTHVASYLEHHGSEEERLEAFYYTGSVFRDQHNSPEAIVWYRRAADYGEKDIEVIDTNTLSKVYSQLGYLQHLQYNEYATLECCKRNYQLRNGVNPSFYPPLELARSYHTLFKYIPDSTCYKDSAYVYYTSLFDDEYSNSLNEDFGILGELLHFYTVNGYKTDADRCLLLLNRDIRNLPENVRQAKSTYFDIYGPADSCLYYCEMVYHETNSIRTRNAASLRLMKSYQEQGNKTKALEFANVFAETSDSIEQMTMLRQTSNAYNEYVYNRNLEEEAIIKEKAEKTKRISAIIVAFLLCVFLAWYITNKRKLFKIQLEKNKALEENMNLLIKADAELKRQKETALLKSKIYDQMKNYAENELMPEDNSIWEELYNVIDACYPDYRKNIKARIPKIRIQDIRLLYILRIGIKQSQIARMFNLKGRSVINTRLKRLEEKLGCKWEEL